jgi:transposase
MDRMEIITRPERRRIWSEAEKAMLLAELDASGESVAKFARRRGVSESLLYNWRAARRAQAVAAMSDSEPLSFVPIRVFGRAEDESPALLAPVVPAEAAGPEPTNRASAPQPAMTERPGLMEIDLPNGARLRVDPLRTRYRVESHRTQRAR